MSKLPRHLDTKLKISRTMVNEATRLMNEVWMEFDDGSIRSQELAAAASRLNEVFSILSRDEQVNEHSRTPGI